MPSAFDCRTVSRLHLRTLSLCSLSNLNAHLIITEDLSPLPFSFQIPDEPLQPCEALLWRRALTQEQASGNMGSAFVELFFNGSEYSLDVMSAAGVQSHV